MQSVSFLSVVLATGMVSGTAFGQFEACGTGGSCAEANKTPGCSDAICCEQVCALDAFCCKVMWDDSCALLAESTCNFECSGAPELAYGDNAFDTTASSDILDLAGYCDPGPYGDDALYNTIYYRFTATEDGLHTFSTCNQADFDTRLAVMGSCDPASVQTCLDDTAVCGGYTTVLYANLLADVEVIVAIGGYGAGDLGLGTLSIDTFSIEPELAGYRQHRVEDGGDDAWYGAYRVPAGLTWDVLRDAAADTGDELIVIHSQQVNEIGQVLFQSSGAADGMAIGLYQENNDSEPDGGWAWVDGSAVDYTNWYDGEPNDGGGTEHFGELWDGGTWNDRSTTNAWNGYYVRFADGASFDPAVNDDCAGAVELAEGANSFSTTNNYGMESLSEECTSSDSTVIYNTGWYTFTATMAGTWSIETCGTAWDTRMAAFDGCGGELLGCNDDACGLQSRLLLDMEEGAMATIVIGGYGTADAGGGVLTLGFLEPPVTTDALSINFRGGSFVDGSDGGLCYDTDLFPAGAPGFGTTYWQNLRGPTVADAVEWFNQGEGDDPANLIDGTGTGTGASIDFAVNNTWRVLSYPADDTDGMRRGYLDSNGLGGVSATISGITYDTYTAIIYFDSDGNDRPGSTAANGGEARYFLTENASIEGYIFPPLVEATATTKADAVRSHYAVFEGLTGDTCTIVLGQFAGNIGLNGLQIIESKGGGSCTGDFNGDGEVNGADFGLILAAWGPCAGCAEDMNGDDVVNGADVGLALAAWGPCP